MVQKINSSASLRDAIIELEMVQAGDVLMLKQQFHLAYESVKPINLIKSTFKEVAADKDLKDNLINSAAGLTAGYLAKALFVRASHNPLKKFVGTALMFGVSKLIANNPETVKAVVHSAVNIVRSTLGNKFYSERGQAHNT